MSKYILMLLLIFPVLSWACEGVNSGDVSMTNLPEKILLSAGAQVLLCSEIGSEGRNFQFASNLVMFDLPFNPDLLEQRIGRLDRIGQAHDIQIHVPYLEKTAQSVLVRWYHEGLDAFEHTCPTGTNCGACND